MIMRNPLLSMLESYEKMTNQTGGCEAPWNETKDNLCSIHPFVRTEQYRAVQSFETNSPEDSFRALEYRWATVEEAGFVDCLRSFKFWTIKPIENKFYYLFIVSIFFSFFSRPPKCPLQLLLKESQLYWKRRWLIISSQTAEQRKKKRKKGRNPKIDKFQFSTFRSKRFLTSLPSILNSWKMDIWTREVKINEWTNE